jgi:hypothetical protein
MLWRKVDKGMFFTTPSMRHAIGTLAAQEATTGKRDKCGIFSS